MNAGKRAGQENAVRGYDGERQIRTAIRGNNIDSNEKKCAGKVIAEDMPNQSWIRYSKSIVFFKI